MNDNKEDFLNVQQSVTPVHFFKFVGLQEMFGAILSVMFYQILTRP